MASESRGEPGDARPANGATLDGLLRRQAEATPDRIAIVDDPRRPEWNRSPAERLTYAEAERRVAALAAFFGIAGFKPATPIVLAAPNAVDTVLVFLGALRAGLVVLPVPPTWRRRDWLAHLPRLAPEAVIAAGIVDGTEQGLWMRDAADRIPSIRFQFAFGDERPGGLLDLRRLAEVGSRAPAPPALPPASSGRLATVTFAGTGGIEPAQLHGRSHAGWLAAGAMVAGKAGLRPGARFFVPFALTGLAGLGAGLVAWLIAGGTLFLHHPRSFADLVAHAGQVEADVLLLPGPVAEPVAAALARNGAADGARLAVWKDAYPRQASRRVAEGTLFDVTVIDELAFAVERRDEGGPAGFPVGMVSVAGTGILETRVEGGPRRAGDRERPLVGGAVALRGTMVPAAARLPLGSGVSTGLALSADGFVRSDIACRLADGRPPRLVPLGAFGDVVTVAGLPVAGGVLDRLFADAPGVAEAAAFVAGGPVPVLKVAVVAQPGATPDAAALAAALTVKGVASHQLPAEVVPVEAIARGPNGAPQRTALAEATPRA